MAGFNNQAESKVVTQGRNIWWSPESLEKRRGNLAARGSIVSALRGFFKAQGFTEVETPALQVSPGMEPYLNPFVTRLEAPFEDGAREMYLHTSPEFAMKKLLAAGAGDIFQFARVFRNGEHSDSHHSEFTMLEWYRLEGEGHQGESQPAYDALMEDCLALLTAALRAAEKTEFSWQGKTCDPGQGLHRLSVTQAFGEYCGIDLARAMADPLRPDPAPLVKEAARLGIRAGEGDRFDDVFFRIFLEKIEPHLGVGKPTILYGYPLSMAANACADPENPAFAERFELFVCGLELGNAFHELRDAQEQRRRFTAANQLRKNLSKPPLPVDEDFLCALEAGLPDCAGIALGLDRLVMLATGAQRIEDVLWAPV